jgi:hypothetical protein
MMLFAKSETNCFHNPSLTAKPRNLRPGLILLSLLFSSTMLLSCQKKVAEITPEQAIKIQYDQGLKKRWSDLTVTDERILAKCIEHDAEGGCTLDNIQLQEKEAGLLQQKGYLRWNSDTQRYKMLPLGIDVHAMGQKLIAEELQKDKSQRAQKILKESKH